MLFRITRLIEIEVVIDGALPAPIAPRQPVFAPARLTEAERALVAVLSSNPEEAKVVAERQAETQQEAAEFMEQAFNPR